jgi:hypothetical protein
MSTPSSLRVRTLSTATTSSRLSTKVDSPTKRIEKRPRLSSESRLTNSLLASTSTIAADLSSDSIDIADVSALLAVSPGVSPVKSIAPSSIRRVVVRRPPLPSSGPSTPSRRAGTSIISTRQNPSYLSPNPPKGATSSLRRPPARVAGTAERGSILSWADFSNQKYREEDLNLIAEIVPLKGVITPGSDDFHPRERVDSGWGMDSPHRFTGLSSGPSIGQLMFPSVEPSKPDHPPDGEAIASRLLYVQLSAAEREVSELQAKIRTYESQIDAAGGTQVVTVVTDTDAAKERALRSLQNAELEAKAAFLEESLNGLRQTVSEKDTQLAQSLFDINRLETQCEVERREKDEGLRAAQELVENSALEVERRVSAVLAEKVAKATETESQKWRRKFEYLAGAEDVTQEWRTVRSLALADLDAVRHMQATLRVLMAGVEAINLNHSDIS